MPATSVTKRRACRAGWSRDVLGVAWVVAAAAAVMAPALAHGSSLGPFDLLSQSGLSQQPGVVLHNIATSDLITESIPWTALAWTQVHHATLPLWNPYSALGMPLAFNWQAATFSVPTLLGYLAPLRLAYTVQVLVTLVIAGTGVYVLGRVLHLGVLGCTMAATVYELSGPFMAWLGWPVASVVSWAGWLFAAAILVVRGRRRSRAIAFFAVVVACAIYAGQPDTLVVLGTALTTFAVALLGLRTRWARGSGPILRPSVDLVVAAVVGAALGAPLLLPGIQLTAGSVRAVRGADTALTSHDLIHVLFQGFDGLPVAGSRVFGARANTILGGFTYVDSAAYVGVIVVVLCFVAVAIRWRNRSVLALTVVGVVTAAMTFVEPLTLLLDKLPALGSVHWHRAVLMFAFSVAVLAGVGTDALVRSHRPESIRRWAGGGFAVSLLVLAGLWVFGRGRLPPADAHIRAQSFVWPTIAGCVGLGAVALMVAAQRRAGAHSGAETRTHGAVATWAGVVLLACETAFLVTAGAPIWTSSPTFAAPSRAVVTLQRAVGSSLVGFGTNTCLGLGGPELGVTPNANLLFDLDEMAVYDPLIQRTYYSSWRSSTGQPPFPPLIHALVPISVLCPAVSSSTVARHYGVAFVLEPAGGAGPQGAVFDMKIGDESLYRIPGSAPATLVHHLPKTTPPGPNARGTPVPVTHPSPASWKVVTRATTPQILRLRLTGVPGWHATIDGQPLHLQEFSLVMLEAQIPAGRHTIELTYWPTAFTVGIALAVCALVGLSAALLVDELRRRRDRRPRPTPSGSNVVQ